MNSYAVIKAAHATNIINIDFIFIATLSSLLNPKFSQYKPFILSDFLTVILFIIFGCSTHPNLIKIFLYQGYAKFLIINYANYGSFN